MWYWGGGGAGGVLWFRLTNILNNSRNGNISITTNKQLSDIRHNYSTQILLSLVLHQPIPAKISTNHRRVFPSHDF